MDDEDLYKHDNLLTTIEYYMQESCKVTKDPSTYDE